MEQALASLSRKGKSDRREGREPFPAHERQMNTLITKPSRSVH